ncbi:hypothetical protein [Clostridium sp.]|uniref:hypothetical protein n=1 Tax=Clostridium sp. TaxID=1506 RepID=UPI00257F227C|nr:hypothetical protein [Clostridium sp.]MBE6058217.1 hypothetical protein [Clostridium sp.]
MKDFGKGIDIVYMDRSIHVYVDGLSVGYYEDTDLHVKEIMNIARNTKGEIREHFPYTVEEERGYLKFSNNCKVHPKINLLIRE